MKLRSGWMFAIAVVCLLWSVTAEACLNPAACIDQHVVAGSADSCSPSSCLSLRVLSEDWIHPRAGPPNIFFTPDVSLQSLRTEDLDPEGPPCLVSLESHGPPGKYGALGNLGALRVAGTATEALQTGVYTVKS